MKLVLFQPDIAQNLGAAMRLCACFGVELDVIEPCGFPLTTKALRRTAMDYGSPDTLNRHKSWESYQKSETNGRLILFTTQAATPIQDFAFHPDDRLIFGRESAGAPPEVHDAADARVIVPIAASARSFNLVSTASIAVFEALRQTAQLPHA